MLTLVTGAAGFLGRAVVSELLASRRPGDDLRLTDRAPLTIEGPGVEVRVGDLADPAFRSHAVRDVGRIIHLAALPGGASEADYAHSRRVNLETPSALMEEVASRERPIRFVYASSIAVFGTPMPPLVDDDTAPRPTMTYGAHKLMTEVALQNLTRLGRLDGLALRLPGVVARPPGAEGLKSAFMSDLFHALAARRPYALPTSPRATVWVMSARAAAQALVHAAHMAPPAVDTPRAMTLPALRIGMDELVRVTAKAAGASEALVTYAPDDDLERQFGRLPPLSTALALRLGFHHDGDVEALVRRTLAGLDGR